MFVAWNAVVERDLSAFRDLLKIKPMRFANRQNRKREKSKMIP